MTLKVGNRSPRGTTCKRQGQWWAGQLQVLSKADVTVSDLAGGK